MNISSDRAAMPKEVSALNTFWLVQYLQEHHPDVDLEQMIDRITTMFPCYIENLQSGILERVALRHLQIPRYWFSHRFVKTLHDLIQERIPDPRLGYRMGSTIYKTQPLLKTALGVPLLGLHRVAGTVAREAAKYNRTKQYLVRRLEKGFVGIRIVHQPGIVVNEFAMQWNAGCFASYARLAGARDITVEIRCVDPGPVEHTDTERAVYDFEIRYREPSLGRRIGKALMVILPGVRQLTEQAAAVETEHQEQILNRDRIIRERTERLLSIQRKLIDEERDNIEQKLQKISLELVTTEERERRAIAEDLHDSVTQMLALSLLRIKAAQRDHEAIGELGEIRGYLEQALDDLRALTFQISPPVLYDFGLEAALKWLVSEVNSRHRMRLGFANLLDAPLDLGQQQKVTLYRIVRELVINTIKHARTRDGQIILSREGDRFVAEIADEGIGFDPASVNRGFGLSSLKDRLLCLDGSLTLITAPGEGTIVQVSVPLDRLAALPEAAKVAGAAASAAPN